MQPHVFAQASEEGWRRRRRRIARTGIERESTILFIVFFDLNFRWFYSY